MAISIPLATCAAYSFSRFRMWGERAMLVTILATQFVPAVVIVLPFFLMFRSLGMLDTRPALILVDTAIVMPFAVWMIKGFVDGIPLETEEAALVDGSTRLQVLRRVVLPMAAPGIITAAIFAFIISWNEFLFALILTRRDAVTLPVGLQLFNGQEGHAVAPAVRRRAADHGADDRAGAAGAEALRSGHDHGSGSLMAQVVLKDVEKRWASFVAVARQSLTVTDGEFLVLLGPSGCGKTTTMRMVAGLEEPSGGEIWIGDRCVNDVMPKDRDIAMVFQNYGLYPHLTVGENIAYPLRVRGVRAPTARCGWPRRRARWSWATCCTAARGSCRAGSGSAWRWPAPSCARRRCS